MAEYKHGSMDTSAQQKTFAGFVKGLIWLAGFSIFTLILLAVYNS